VIADPTGALYGTTVAGGGSPCNSGGGCGTVFKLTPTRSGYTESVLHRFAQLTDPTDGYFPQAGLVLGQNGALVGTTFAGGGSSYHGFGIVFKLSPTQSGNYSETVLYAFRNKLNGAYLYAGLTPGDDGALYGAASEGGANACKQEGGCGVVFKIFDAH
jgi:uncharacterized repeat protein (TIGR03803 family)